MSNPNGGSSSIPAPPSDTIAAIATAPGRGAVAIVRISGPDALPVARCIFRSGESLRDRGAVLGSVVDPGGARIDRALALYFASPRSYTGDDVVELHVHGSPAVARDTLLAALAAGARGATPGEFTRRALLAGKLDLTAAEAVADLIAAEGRGAARAAVARLSGGLAAVVERERAVLDALVEELAAALDFPDEVEAPEPVTVAAKLDAVDVELGALARTWESGRLVREGVAVALVGPPNAGKSTLLNALLGADRALVSDVPGTTRDTVEETLALGNGATARLIDTAGLRDGADPLEAAGIARARAALDAATIALVVVDASTEPSPEARSLLTATRSRERLVFFNKGDLGRSGYDAREAAERDALFGSAHDERSVELVRTRLAEAAGADRVDLARPHLGTVRQADAVLEARRALARARQTLDAGDSVDLVASDLAEARAALGELTGRDASESLLDGIFARFCIGK